MQHIIAEVINIWTNKQRSSAVGTFFLMYEGHSISNAILAIFFCLNILLKFDLAFLKHKFNSAPARQFNT